MSAEPPVEHDFPAGFLGDVFARLAEYGLGVRDPSPVDLFAMADALRQGAAGTGLAFVHTRRPGWEARPDSPCDVPSLEVDGVRYYPHYVSTACVAGLHGRCRQTGKFDGSPCLCRAHLAEG